MNTQRVEGHTLTLKKCPFCGADSAHVTGTPLESWPYQVWCGGCDARTDECGTEAIAIEVWNTRASIERLEKVNEALVIELMAANAQMEAAAECIEKGRYDEALLHVRAMSGKRAEVIRLAKEPV